MSQVFQTLDLDESTPQTLVLDQNEDQQSLSFVNYSEKIKHIQNLAGDLQSELNTKYTQLQFCILILKMMEMLQFLIIIRLLMLRF